jgi:hypothetical protein
MNVRHRTTRTARFLKARTATGLVCLRWEAIAVYAPLVQHICLTFASSFPSNYEA